MNSLAFNPLSRNFWHQVIKIGGWPILGVIVLIVGGKSFDARDSVAVMSGQVGGSQLLRGGALFLATLILVSNIRGLRIKSGGSVFALVIYAIATLLSTMWSSAPLATLGKSIEIVVGLLFVMLIASSDNQIVRLRALCDAIMALISIELLIVLLGFVMGIDGFFELSAGGFSEFFGRRAVAPFISANSVGYFSILLIAYLFGKRAESGIFFARSEKFYLALALCCLVLSSSRTSLGLFILVSAFFVLRKNKPLFLFLSVIAFAVFVGWLGFLIDFIQGGTAESNLMTLSGRTILWASAYEYFKESPVWGYGFGVGSRDFFVRWGIDGFDEAISSVHNGVLEVLLGVGLIGFLPWVFSILYAASNWRHEFFSKKNFNVVLVSSFPILLVCSLMSVGVGGAQGEMFLLFSIICVIGVGRNNWNKTRL